MAFYECFCFQDHSGSSQPKTDVVQATFDRSSYKKSSRRLCSATFRSTSTMVDRGEFINYL